MRAVPLAITNATSMAGRREGDGDQELGVATRTRTKPKKPTTSRGYRIRRIAQGKRK